MRYLIISDLHSNLEALEAAVQAAEGRYDRVVCCGDVVGYGPDPNAVTDWVRQNVVAVVRGNHDKACCGITDAQDFNTVARTAAMWTRERLTGENLEFLRNLPIGPVSVNGFQILHGSIDDEDEYVFVVEDAIHGFPALGHVVNFFGHTHVQGGFLRTAVGGAQTIRPGLDRDLCSKVMELRPDDQYLINPGSTGQPRDGDARAAFCIYDTEPAPGVVEYCRVNYDVAVTQKKMKEAGLPEVLSLRLAFGR